MTKDLLYLVVMVAVILGALIVASNGTLSFAVGCVDDHCMDNGVYVGASILRLSVVVTVTDAAVTVECISR